MQPREPKKRPRARLPLAASPWRDPWRRGSFGGCPGAQSKLHREAPKSAIDPETAMFGLYASTQEGGWRHIPANLPPTMKLQVFEWRPRSLASDGRE